MAGKLIQYVESRITTRSNQGGSVNVLDGSNTRFGGTVMNLDITPNSSSSKIYVRFCCPVAGESSNHSNSANWFLYHSQAGNDVIVHNHNRSRYYGGGMKPSWQGNGANHCFNIDLQAWVSLGNTTTTTIQIRTGCNGGAMTINGTGAVTPTCYNGGHAQTLLYIMEFA